MSATAGSSAASDKQSTHAEPSAAVREREPSANHKTESPRSEDATERKQKYSPSSALGALGGKPRANTRERTSASKPSVRPISDGGLGVFDRRLGGMLFIGTRVDRFLGRKFVALERLRACELVVRQRDACHCGMELGVRLRKLDFVRTRVDHEKQVALVDDLPILEMNFGEDASDLGA